MIALEQRSPEWHDWRRQGVTASDAAVLLGESPYKSLPTWEEKLGLLKPQDLSGNPNVQRGVREDDAEAVWRWSQHWVAVRCYPSVPSLMGTRGCEPVLTGWI